LFLTDVVSGFSTEMMNNYLEKIKEDPQKRENLLKTVLLGTEVGIILLQESEEFREAFGRIHAEFLKYPESKDVLQKAMKTISH